MSSLDLAYVGALAGLEARVTRIERDLEMLPAPPVASRISVRLIVMLVSMHVGLREGQVLGARRDGPHARARFAIWWLATQTTALPAADIGRMTNRDHTTVLHGLSQANHLREEDEAFRALTDHLLDIIMGVQA